jgi:sulfoxide reductase heme-binding subunit YedZ
MTGATRFPRANLLFWALLTLPGVPLVVAALTPGADLEELLHPSGEWSARLLVIALALTPLSLLLPRSRALRWLLARRRAIGVAAFGYAALHTLCYVLAMGSIDDMLAELGATGIWTGWLALLLLVPLAATSNDRSMRVLRGVWKRVQRLAYPAALLTLIHWVAIHGGLGAALAHFVPLAALQAFRLYRLRNPARAIPGRPT